MDRSRSYKPKINGSDRGSDPHIGNFDYTSYVINTRTEILYYTVVL
jgi:hypothetical protein